MHTSNDLLFGLFSFAPAPTTHNPLLKRTATACNNCNNCNVTVAGMIVAAQDVGQ
jgi:hypothetical protein